MNREPAATYAHSESMLTKREKCSGSSYVQKSLCGLRVQCLTDCPVNDLEKIVRTKLNECRGFAHLFRLRRVVTHGDEL